MQTKIIKINPYRISSESVKNIAKLIDKGGIILYPTDTIYGLGCHAFDGNAIRRIFQIKDRSPKNPALILANSHRMVRELVEDVTPAAELLMKKFWPGPLTILFHASKKMNEFILSEDNKVGIRIPNNKFCLKLIAQIDAPIISTSANVSGKPIKTNINELSKLFDGKIDLIIDAGDITSIVPSTVVNVSEFDVRVIREGVVTKKEIMRAVKESLKL